MLSGLGELKGLTLRKVEQVGSTEWETHEAYAVLGDHAILVGSSWDEWSAFSRIEEWYHNQENYYQAFV
ncbi:hypothetical protein [Streptosporangium canum]|nr:hypothetical protein [Streptosporangium canum]